MYSTSLINYSPTFVSAKLINLLMTLTYKSKYSCDHHNKCYNNTNQLVVNSTLTLRIHTIRSIHGNRILHIIIYLLHT